MNRAARRALGITRKQRTIAGLSFFAMASVATMYGQVLRTPKAYATAADCTVTTGTDNNPAGGGYGTGTQGDLRYCLTLIQGLTNGGSIDFSGTPTVTLAAALPLVEKDTTISGSPSQRVEIRRTTSGSPTFGFLKSHGAGTPDITINHLDIQGFAMAGKQAVIMGGIWESPGVYNSAGKITIYDSLIKDNSSDYAVVYSYYSDDMSIVDSTFEANTATYGAAINFVGDPALATTMTVTRSNFLRNTSTNGSAAAIWANPLSGDFIVHDSTFSGNVGNGSRSRGGAIVTRAPITKIYGSTFVNNETPYEGGALHFDNNLAKTALIEGSTFLGNESNAGGAIYARKTALTITNSSLLENVATGANANGAAIFGNNYSSSTATLNFTTVADNSTQVTGAGYGDIALPPSSITLAGSVVSSVGAACDSAVSDDTSSVTTDTSCALTGPGSVQSATSGQLDLDDTATTTVNGVAQSYRAPRPGSILVSAAPSTNLGTGITTDQIGIARSGSFTIGAVQAVGASAPTVASIAPGTGTTLGGTQVQLRGTGFTGATGVNFGSTPATSFTVIDDSTINAITPASTAGSVAVSVTTPGGTGSLPNAFRFISPNPPVSPPSAPRNVTATPGVESGSVSWSEPASAGSLPITTYEAVSSPGARTCLASAPALTCQISGLTAGISYTFTVRALNGAGWSSPSVPSNAMIPAAPTSKAIVITGARDRSNPRYVVVAGSSTGLVGEHVTPHVRFPGEIAYSTGTGARTVNEQGRFNWQRKTSKKTYVYFDCADIRSNRVIIEAR